MFQYILWLFQSLFRLPTETTDNNTIIVNMNIDLSELRVENANLRQEFERLKVPFQQLTIACVINAPAPSTKKRKKRVKTVKTVKTSKSVKNLTKLLDVERKKRDMLISKIQRHHELFGSIDVFTFMEPPQESIRLSKPHNIIKILNGNITFFFDEIIDFKIVVLTQSNSSEYNQKQQIFFCNAKSFNISVTQNQVILRTTEKKEGWFTRKKCISCKTQFSFETSECRNERCVNRSKFYEMMQESCDVNFGTVFFAMRVILAPSEPNLK